MDTVAERLSKFDFNNIELNSYNILLELICMYSPSECEKVVNDRICNEQHRVFLLAELRRFYAVGDSLKAKGVLSS